MIRGDNKLADILSRQSSDTPRYATNQYNHELRAPVTGVSAEFIEIVPHQDDGGIEAGINLLRELHTLERNNDENNSGAYSFEIWFNRGNFRFIIGCASKQARDQYKHKISNIYTNSDVSIIQSGDSFPRIGYEFHHSGGKLKKKLHSFVPIQQYSTGRSGAIEDPYADIMNEMSSVDNAIMILQVIFEPIPPGSSHKDSNGEDVYDIAKRIHDGRIAGWPKARSWNPIHGIWQKDLSNQREEAAKIVKNQRAQLRFQVNIRYFAASPNRKEVLNRMTDMGSAFSIFQNPRTRQGLEPLPVASADIETMIHYMLDRNWVDRDMVMSLEELAGITHLPSAGIDVPGIQWHGAKKGDDLPAQSHKSVEDDIYEKKSPGHTEPSLPNQEVPGSMSEPDIDPSITSNSSPSPQKESQKRSQSEGSEDSTNYDGNRIEGEPPAGKASHGSHAQSIDQQEATSNKSTDSTHSSSDINNTDPQSDQETSITDTAARTNQSNPPFEGDPDTESPNKSNPSEPPSSSESTGSPSIPWRATVQPPELIECCDYMDAQRINTLARGDALPTENEFEDLRETLIQINEEAAPYIDQPEDISNVLRDIIDHNMSENDTE